jgi:hypothetical protein
MNIEDKVFKEYRRTQIVCLGCEEWVPEEERTIDFDKDTKKPIEKHEYLCKKCYNKVI